MISGNFVKDIISWRQELDEALLYLLFSRLISFFVSAIFDSSQWSHVENSVSKGISALNYSESAHHPRDPFWFTSSGNSHQKVVHVANQV